MPSKFYRDRPYNDLPLLPPSEEAETRAVLKLAVSARSAVEGLKHAGKTIPNQTVLLRAIVLQEARSSSEIENIVTTNDDLYRALSKEDESTNPQTKEVLRYASSVWQGFDLVQRGKRLDASVYSDLASMILQNEVKVRASTGTRVGNPRTREVIYTPPEGVDVISRLLDNLVDFQYGPSELDPLVKVAIGHYQFEATHPFHDGNGRTGRVLKILWMVEKGLLDLPVLYLSRAIIESKSEYYAHLRRVTEQAQWEPWISYFLEIIEVTALETRRRIEVIRRAVDEAKLKARERAPKIYSSELIDLVFSQPYTRISCLEAAGIAKRQTASLYLKELERIGLLRSQTHWRETIYVNDELMTALT